MLDKPEVHQHEADYQEAVRRTCEADSLARNENSPLLYSVWFWAYECGDPDLDYLSDEDLQH